MPVALKPTPVIEEATKSTTPWLHLFWVVAAGLFVSILSLTHGMELSLGLF